MKSKKGFIPGLIFIAYGVLIIIILAMLIFLGYKVSDSVAAFFSFLRTWWWAIMLSITALLFRNQIMAFFNIVLAFLKGALKV